MSIGATAMQPVRIDNEEGSPGGARAVVKSADRVLTLFELLGRWGRPMSHAEIADALGIPKSSLSQLLKTLIGRGWLSYVPASKGYALGEAVRRLARGISQAADLVSLSQPILAELTGELKETSALNVLRGDMGEVVATELGPEALLAVMRLGERSPLYTTSYGKVLLAHTSQEWQEEYFARTELAPSTSRSIRSVEELRIQLEVIRREGVGYSFEEQVPGVVATARPVFGPMGDVVGAISIASAAIRYDAAKRTQICDALGRAVARLGQQLAILNTQ